MSIPATPQILRATLRSTPSNGHATFVPQIRKLVFEFCDKRVSSAPLRDYLLKNVEELAVKNPHVEFVVRQRAQKQPIIRGFYSAYARSNLRLGLNDNHCIYSEQPR